MESLSRTAFPMSAGRTSQLRLGLHWAASQGRVWPALSEAGGCGPRCWPAAPAQLLWVWFCCLPGGCLGRCAPTLRTGRFPLRCVGAPWGPRDAFEGSHFTISSSLLAALPLTLSSSAPRHRAETSALGWEDEGRAPRQLAAHPLLHPPRHAPR